MTPERERKEARRRARLAFDAHPGSSEPGDSREKIRDVIVDLLYLAEGMGFEPGDILDSVETAVDGEFDE